MASTIKATNISTPDGTGNITVDRPLSGSGASLTSLPAANLTGSIAAIDGNALVGISPRNFIIDGDFTQWPEGTSITASNGSYGPALSYVNFSGAMAITLAKETTVIPTLAESGRDSAQSMKIDVTTADTSLSAGDFCFQNWIITGTDYQALHQKEVTFNFWIRSGTTGTFCVSFQNNSTNRVYVSEQTINVADTWEEKTITLTLDTSGTWLFTEADAGLKIRITLASGSNRQIAGSANTWLSETDKESTSNQTNMVGDATKDVYISQVGLYLGASAPTFTSPPISTVKGQIEYYVEVRDHSGGEYMFPGQARSTGEARGRLKFNTRKRAVPTLTWTTGSPQALNAATTTQTGTGNSFSSNNEEGAFVYITGASGLVAGNASILAANGTSQLLIDSRH